MTFAERLGWGPRDRVLIFHTDDAGMSQSSNLGAIEALERGVAQSWSVMVLCDGVPGIAEYLRAHPGVDSGVHLTLTSEWVGRRWRPLSGAPGLQDPSGHLWPDAAGVLAHATPDEAEAEIRAQVARAEELGLPITHLDSHMGVLLASPAFFERYVKIGVEKGIPVLVAPGVRGFGRWGLFARKAYRRLLRMEVYDFPGPPAPAVESVWDAGLPVIDRIAPDIYGWEKKDKFRKLTAFLRWLRPGIVEIPVHCSLPTEDFALLEDSGGSRQGDTQVMVDPGVRALLEAEGIVLTTWRELMARRQAAGRRAMSFPAR
ncbi:MAG: ChbG/HpnK family deacetylase [Nitrospiraceae bacterium]|nr:ChbG/HpnK family deacetylase [Nitrospiraceae bacterium]